MRGILIGISEAVQGQVYHLSEAEVLLGRGSASTLRVPHSSVSREHCLIRVHEHRIEIQDKGSRNGTFVNGLPVRERALLDGDELMFGDVVFQFRSVEPGAVIPANPGMVEPSFSQTLNSPHVPLAREAATLVRIGEIARMVQDLYLDRVSDSQSDSARRLFEAMFEMIPSRRGALLLFVKGSDEQRLLAEFAADAPKSAVKVPRTVKHRLFESRAAAAGIEERIAWLASPLLFSGRIAGALYLDSGASRRDYGDRDLQMISAVCEVLALAIENARDLQMLQFENGLLRAGITPDSALIGDSASMSALQGAILKVARASATVLICGESGTGKELVARAIHRNSPRSARPFVALNCAAITETLVESEFFGYEKGAFTGAVAQRKGRLETADGGTVFLDEIGELSLPLQAKLLRVLQEHEFERVGGSRTVKVDIRVVAATNRDLEKAIQVGTFREDLFYRLNVVRLHVPPLRDRRDDILLLATHFVRKCSEQIGRRVSGFSREARALLVAYDWPGNVRELQNVIERAVVLGSSETIIPEDLPETLFDATPTPDLNDDGFHASVRQHRRRIILAAIERAGGNVAEAARALKLHPVYLHRLITSLGLRQSGSD
ncbi:MAG: sigma 54-interacting transcriptional regulator [Bryobacteraceae bacterium]